MIVRTMTPDEIRIVIAQKWKSMGEWFRKKRSRFRNNVKSKATHPLMETYEHNDGDNVTFLLTLCSKSRKEIREVGYAVNVLCDVEGKKHLMSLFDDYDPIAAVYFSDHFISRFRERILKDNSLTTEQTMKSLMDRHYEYKFVVLDETGKNMASPYEEAFNGSVTNMALVIPEGVCFGEMNPEENTIIMKTVISVDMLGDSQLVYYLKKSTSNIKNPNAAVTPHF